MRGGGVKYLLIHYTCHCPKSGPLALAVLTPSLINSRDARELKKQVTLA